jgi:hypothetical protein
MATIKCIYEGYALVVKVSAFLLRKKEEGKELAWAGTHSYNRINNFFPELSLQEKQRFV